jgi:NAD-dependent deacetylase
MLAVRSAIAKTPVVRITKGTKVFILTGAGISAESGIRTFRDSNGLWEEHRVEDVASPEGWVRDPELVWRFYSARRKQARSVAPNAAHLALARLEAHLGDDFFLCTQNVDGLHEAAGSRRLVHLHGELAKSRCENSDCSLPPFEDEGLYLTLAEIPACPKCGARIRPHIVWFGEIPFDLHAVKRKARACDLFCTIGSSGAVYPAAGLVDELRCRQQSGERCRSIYVGLERPENAGAFDELVLGRAGDVLPGLLEPAP